MNKYDEKEFEEFIKQNSDEKYRDFHARLTRTDYPLNGIRLPVLRKYAKEIAKREGIKAFIMQKPKSYEQCMLKGMVISYMKLDDSEFFPLLENYIDDIDDWALTDTACGNIKRKDSAYLEKIKEYAKSDNIWYARWGIVAVMVNFFDRDDIIYEVVDNLIAEDYYVDMALAWLIQVLAVKNRKVAEYLLSGDKINVQVKKYAARKIKDSFRISKEDKEYFTQIGAVN